MRPQVAGACGGTVGVAEQAQVARRVDQRLVAVGDAGVEDVGERELVPVALAALARIPFLDQCADE